MYDRYGTGNRILAVIMTAQAQVLRYRLWYSGTYVKAYFILSFWFVTIPRSPNLAYTIKNRAKIENLAL
jgi:hypothetical protein